MKTRKRPRPGQNAPAAEKSNAGAPLASRGGADVTLRASSAPSAVVTPGEIVRAFYRVLLFREPDPGGFDGYVREIQAGRPIEHFMRGLLKSKEFAGLHRRFLATYVSVAASQPNLAKTAAPTSAISPTAEGAAQKTELERTGSLAHPDAKR